MLRILGPLISESIAVGFQPATRVGRFLTASLGVSRDGVIQLGVLMSGLSRLLVTVFAILFVVAPWGIGSEDLESGVRRAFFGFNVGDVEISPRSLIVALLLFGALYQPRAQFRIGCRSAFCPRRNSTPACVTLSAQASVMSA